MIAYGYDGTWFEHKPLSVVLPTTVEQISAVQRLASAERIAITPRAMGSGLSGGSVPLYGSIVICVMRMNRIIEIDEANRIAIVQAGVIDTDLQPAVEARAPSDSVPFPRRSPLKNRAASSMRSALRLRRGDCSPKCRV